MSQPSWHTTYLFINIPKNSNDLTHFWETMWQYSKFRQQFSVHVAKEPKPLKFMILDHCPVYRRIILDQYFHMLPRKHRGLESLHTKIPKICQLPASKPLDKYFSVDRYLRQRVLKIWEIEGMFEKDAPLKSYERLGWYNLKSLLKCLIVRVKDRWKNYVCRCTRDSRGFLDSSVLLCCGYRKQRRKDTTAKIGQAFVCTCT